MSCCMIAACSTEACAIVSHVILGRPVILKIFILYFPPFFMPHLDKLCATYLPEYAKNLAKN